MTEDRKIMNNKIEFTLEDYDLVVEETERLSNRGIFVFRNLKSSQLLYVRLASDADRAHGGFWEIVSSKELKTLNVQESYIEESYNRTVENQGKKERREFEESAKSQEEFDAIYEAEKKKLTDQKKNDPNTKTLKIVVENGNQPKDKTAEELAEENEDLKGKFAIVAEMELAKRKKALGLSQDDPMTGEQLRGYEKAVKDLKNQNSGSPSGSAPLNAAQLGQSAQIGYESIPEMFDAVRFKATFSQDPEEKAQNQRILDELLRKWARAKKTENIQDKIPESMQMTPKEYQERKRKQRSGQ